MLDQSATALNESGIGTDTLVSNELTQQHSQRLEHALSELDLEASAAQREQLLTYLAELLKWNRAYNLTAIRSVDHALDLHLIDSLTVINRLEPGALLDVGTGGGLPGIPIAILQPERPVTLLDSNSKKTRFLKQLVFTLKLQNVAVVCARVEDFAAPSGYACITSRAFASLPDMVAGTEHLLANKGVWQAMKGQMPDSELAELAESVVIRGVEALVVPGVAADRHLITMTKAVTDNND